MDKKLQQAFNEHIKNEIYSSYLYLSMAAYAESLNLPGFAHWLMFQSKEETGHAMKVYGFLTDCGQRVILEAVPKPPSDFSSPEALVEAVLKHEKQVTQFVNRLYDLSLKVSDHASSIFLQWFITEQVEEEKNVSAILAKLQMIGGKSSGILYLDKELKKRGI